jgi:sugar phosphate permease
LLQLLVGYFGDKFGPRLMLCVSLLIVCAATAATGAAGGLASLFAARLALGIGEGATFSTATRAMSVWTPERRWAFAPGITPFVRAARQRGDAAADRSLDRSRVLARLVRGACGEGSGLGMVFS